MIIKSGSVARGRRSRERERFTSTGFDSTDSLLPLLHETIYVVDRSRTEVVLIGVINLLIKYQNK